MNDSYIDHPKRMVGESLKRKTAGLLAVLGSISLSACGVNASPGPGYDVSYPQCSQANQSESIDLPNARSFALIGLNGGNPKTLNPCFSSQMDWARGSVENKGISKASIYINAANPGPTQSKEWPHSGTYNSQPCKGDDSIACASLYGQRLAARDVQEFETHYGKSRQVRPEDFPWWVDVESGNSWECNSGLATLCDEPNAVPVPNGAYARNASVLNGISTELQSHNIKVGVYTNKRQWNLVVANLVSTTPEAYPALHGLTTWVSGAASREDAVATCKQPPFGGLGRTVLAQYTPAKLGSLDENIVC